METSTPATSEPKNPPATDFMNDRKFHFRQIPREFLDEVGCEACGHSKAEKLFRIRGFQILRCESCGVRHVSPRLNAKGLEALYSGEEYYHSDNSLVCGYGDYVGDKKNIMATFQRRFDWMKSQAPDFGDGRLLDIGCATGFSVELALQRGWDAYGIEYSEYAANVARQKLGDRVRHCSFENHPHESGSFKNVLMWDVPEHLLYPREALRIIGDLIAPGGYLSIITPDAGSFLARIMGRFWMEYAKPAEHIFFFTRPQLEKMLNDNGFDVVAETTAGKHIDLNALVDRLVAYLPWIGRIKPSASSFKVLSRPFYLDPGDKMMLLARKR